MTELSVIVERCLSEQYGLDVSYLGVVAGISHGHDCLVVAAVLQSISSSLVDDPTLKFLSLTQVSSLGADVDHAEHYVTVWRWWQTARVTRDLGSRIHRAMSTSLAYLDTHVSYENGRLGWNLFQDGSSIGVLSTAEALLAHVHAGVRGEFVEHPAQTIEALQNPDGGWQVRRSLVGSRSDISVTESTCACVWALREGGHSVSAQSIRRGISWLELCQRPDGGWPSAAGGTSLVFPTTAALRALAGAGNAESAAKGVAWLRSAQRPDGGWGATSRAIVGRGSEAAYTGYALVTLLKCGVQPSDPAVVNGAEFLLRTFDPDHDEPWLSTTSMTVIDTATSARLDFRHFGTPWALAALVAVGYGLDEFAVLGGVDRLLALQQDNGTWRCAVSPPESPPVWTTHDALFALRAVLDAKSDQLAPIGLRGYHEQEREAVQATLARLLTRQAAPVPLVSRPHRLTTVWMSVLTVVVLMLTLSYLGVFRQWESGSDTDRTLAAVASLAVTALGAVAPSILLEEYRIRRTRRFEGDSDPTT